MTRVLDAVPLAPETATAGDVRDALPDLPRGTVNSYLRRLRAEGLLVQEAKGAPYSRPPSDGGHDDEHVVYSAGERDGDVELDLVTYSAGHGAQATRAIVRSRVEIETATGYSADALVPIWVEGDSMFPFILPNSLAWALPMDRFSGNGVYAFEMEDHRLVKQVDVLLGGVLRVSARNREAYPDAEEWEPVEEADTENTYRSRSTGRTGVVCLTGRVVAFTQVT